MSIKIRSVELENCFQHRSVKAKLSNFHVIVGPNGSGKSNFVESMLYALGLKLGLPGTKDTMITMGADKGSINLELEHEGKPVFVTASLNTTSRSIKFDKIKINRHLEVLEYLERTLLGTPFDVVTQASVVRQEGLTEGLFDPPAKRMDTFVRLAGMRDVEVKRQELQNEKDRFTVPLMPLNIEETERQLEEAKTNQTKMIAESSGLSGMLDETKIQWYQKTVMAYQQANEARAKLEKLKVEYADLLNSINMAEKAVQEPIDELTKLVFDMATAEDALAKAQQALTTFESDRKNWQARQALEASLQRDKATADALKQPEEYAGQDPAEFEALVGEITGKLSEQKKALDQLAVATGAVCPTCRRSLSAEEKKAIIDRLSDSVKEVQVLRDEANLLRMRAIQEKEASDRLLKAYANQKSALDSRIGALEAEFVRYKDIVQPVYPEEAAKLIDKISNGAKTRKALEAKISEIQSTITEGKAKLAAIQGRIAELTTQTDIQLPEPLSEMQKYLDVCYKAKSTLAEFAGRIAELSNQIERDTAKLVDLKAEQKRLETMKRYWDFIEFARNALHRNNFPSGKVKAFIDQMLLNANVYLDVMHAGFSVTYDNETGFTAYFPADKKAIRADRLSGGQKVTFALAFRFAVNELKSDTGFLILDEPTAYLDTAHVDRVVEALMLVKRKLTPRVQVIVITHDERLTTAADGLLRF